MDKIIGEGNWRIEYEEIPNEGIIITKGITCDAHAKLPEEINGISVIGIGDYALSGRIKVIDENTNNKVVEIRGDMEVDSEWNNKNILSLTMPKKLNTIGSYALMGCFKLKTLKMNDGKYSWGHSVFMNCMSLRDIILNSPSIGFGDCLYHICTVTDRELEVSIKYNSGDMTKIFFPEYAEVWEENTPARQFNPGMEGVGYPYHHAFKDKQIDWNEYDGIWERASKRWGIKHLLIPISWLRLQYPEGLEDRFKVNYISYVIENKNDVMNWLISRNNSSGVKKLLSMTDFTPEEISKYSEIVRNQGDTMTLGVLIGENKDKCPVGRVKTFEL